jgi:hypothetical protein
VARVKKSGAKAGRATPKRAGATLKAARGGSGAKSRASKGRGNAAKTPATPPANNFRVRELNAQQKCGPGTSVERLFRVDETGDAPRAHLVFQDRRHGWYCEHGVQCPAVAPARRMGEARTSQVGRNHNGRMRA